MPWPEFFALYGVVLLAILFGAFVARATGVGFALLLVAVLLAQPHLDQPTVLYLVAPLSIMNLGLIALNLHRSIPWDEIRNLTLPVLVGVLIGLAAGVLVAKLWVLIFGLTVVAYNIWTMARPTPAGAALSVMAKPWIGGGLTGLMTGSLSFPGPPISAYMLARSHVGDQVRVTIAVVAISAALIRLVLGAPFVSWQPEFWQILGCGAVLIALGTLLGMMVAKRMSNQVQRLLIIALSGVAFLQLAWGLWGELAGA